MPTLKTIRVHGGKPKSKLPWLILLPLTLTILIWMAYVGNHHRWQMHTTSSQQHITKTIDDQPSTKPTTTPTTTIDNNETQEENKDTNNLDIDSDHHNKQQQQQQEEEVKKTVPQQQQQSSPRAVIVVPASPPRPDLLSFLAHHNAGSDAISCLLGILTSSPSSSNNNDNNGGESSTASTTSLNKPTVPLNSPPSKLDLLTALHVNQYSSGQRGGGAAAKTNNKPPAVFFSPEALEVECFKANNNTMCSYPSCPCGTIEDSTSTNAPQCLQQQQQQDQQQSCYIPLPFVHHSMLHLIRNPVDVVVAGYMKKTEDSVQGRGGGMGDDEETTLLLQMTLDKVFQPALQSGVSMDALKLQLSQLDSDSGGGVTIEGTGSSKKTYGEVLRELPLEKGVVLEFWRAVPAVYAMARQHQILGRLDYVITVKAEEEEDGGRRDLGRRIEEMLNRGGVGVDTSQVEEAGKQCFANMITAQSVDSVDSAGSGGGGGGGMRGEKWNRAVEALFGEEAVGRKLCELLAMLGYPSSNYICH